MARVRFSVCTTAEVALTTAGKTVLSVFTPADRRLAIRGFSIAFDGVSSTAGAAQVQLVVHSSSGTFSSATCTKDLPGTTEAIGTSGSFDYSTEPSKSAYVRTYNVNPMTGYERAFAGDEEIEVIGGGRFGIYVTASSAVNCLAFLNCEE